MRLLTHNFLKSNARGTEHGFPLKIEASSISYEETQYEEELVRKMLSKMDLPVLLAAAQELIDCSNTNNYDASMIPDLSTITLEEIRNCTLESPAESSSGKDGMATEALLKSLHTILFDIHIMEGHLICPGTGRKFPIHDGIPNMILHEDEV
mmetsp:Transcript_10620/g.15346  ORF Transcript_10620/g.15346 Transcript_10620/m.15346 type:complete len:152 (-) Transcript_10620:504-959(-)